MCDATLPRSHYVGVTEKNEMASHLVVDLRNRRLLHQLNLERLTMSNTIIVGCDLHDRKMALQIACGKELLQSKFVANNCMDRGRMVGLLKRLAKENQADRIVFAYEASGSGFGLLDELIEAGIECYVLAPSALPHSSKSRKRKTDMRDAQIILEGQQISAQGKAERPADRRSRGAPPWVRWRFRTIALKGRHTCRRCPCFALSGLGCPMDTITQGGDTLAGLALPCPGLIYDFGAGRRHT